jgi:hypothetical protein
MINLTSPPQDFTLCNVFFRRDFARRLNAFANPDNLSCETELFLLSCLHGNMGIIKGSATVYRIHPNNLLKSVRNNPRLCWSLDSLLSPYLAAQKVGLEDCAETLRTSTRMDREIAINLLKIACLDLPFFKQAKAAPTERAPDLAHAIFQRPIYCMAEWLGRAFPFLYPAYIKFKKVRIRVFEVNRHPKPVARQNTMPKDE